MYNSVMEIALPVIVFLLFAISLIGIFLPFVPGLALAWIGFIIFVLSKGVFLAHIWWIILLTLLTIIALLSDTIFSLVGAKAYNSSKYGIIGGFCGFILGFFVMPPVGIIILPFVGIYLGEIFSGKDSKQATKAIWGALIGMLVSVGLKVLVWCMLLIALLLLIF